MNTLSDEQLLQLQTFLRGINAILGLTPSNASEPGYLAHVPYPSISKKLTFRIVGKWDKWDIFHRQDLLRF